MITPRALGNALLNEVEFRLGRSRLMSMPVTVDVVLTKACNFACTFCKDYETPFGSKRISLENFERIGRQLFPTARRLNICSGGEPYLHTGLEDILRIAKRYSLYTWLLSNGSILKEERVRRIVRDELVTEHGFSVDGIKPATVEAIRLNAKLPVVLANIAMLRRITREENKSRPKITIRYALMRSNIEELPDAIDHWGREGIDSLLTGWLSIANGMDHNLSLFYHQDLTEKVFREARRVAAKHPRLKVRLPPLIRDDMRKQTDPDACRAPWRFVMIDTNGEVLPCYRAFEALRLDKVYDEDGVAFASIWNSEKYQALRRTVNRAEGEKFYPYCATCENRLGWSRESSHLGDETWMKTLGKEWVPGDIDHQRPLKGTAAKALKELADNKKKVTVD